MTIENDDTPCYHSNEEYLTDVLVISDARTHPLVHDNLAIRDLQVIAYAGIPLITDEGHVLGSFCVIDHEPRVWTDRELDILRDLAASVMTEIALGTMNERLEAQVRERTRELEAAREAAQETSRLKGEFLATISHEFRTPMTAIIGYTDIVLGTELTDDQRDFLQTVRGSADTLFRVLTDILDLAALSAGEAQLVIGTMMPHTVVAQAVESVRTQAGAKGLVLRTEVAPAVPARLWGDARRLQLVLRHLLDNAVKFTEGGEVLVRATVDAATDARVVLRFAVQDTGIGIAEADRQRLFQLFTQVDGSSTRSYGGTGVGLAMVWRLVELMGGCVGVESVVGQGSTFWFTAPLAVTRPALQKSA